MDDHAALAPPAAPALSASWIRVVVTCYQSRAVVRVHGEADAYTAGQLHEEMMAAFLAEPTSLVVDLEGLTFCDLAGTDVLHEVGDRAARRGIPVEVRGMSEIAAWLYATFPSFRTEPSAG